MARRRRWPLRRGDRFDPPWENPSAPAAPDLPAAQLGGVARGLAPKRRARRFDPPWVNVAEGSTWIPLSIVAARPTMPRMRRGRRWDPPVADAPTPLAFDAGASGTAFNSTTISWSHPTAGSFRFGIVDLHSSVVPTGVTWEGVAMVALGAAVDVLGDGASWYTKWRILAPPPGLAFIVATLPTTGDGRGISKSYVGAHQSTLNAPVTAQGNDAAPTVVVASSASELVDDGLAMFVIATVGAGQTLRASSSGGAGERNVLGSTEPGAASVTMDWTLNTSTFWVLRALSILPAGAPDPPPASVPSWLGRRVRRPASRQGRSFEPPLTALAPPTAPAFAPVLLAVAARRRMRLRRSQAWSPPWPQQAPPPPPGIVFGPARGRPQRWTHRRAERSDPPWVTPAIPPPNLVPVLIVAERRRRLVPWRRRQRFEFYAQAVLPPLPDTAGTADLLVVLGDSVDPTLLAGLAGSVDLEVVIAE